LFGFKSPTLGRDSLRVTGVTLKEVLPKISGIIQPPKLFLPLIPSW